MFTEDREIYLGTSRARRTLRESILDSRSCRGIYMADLLASEVVGSWAMPTPATRHEEKCDYRKEAMGRTSAEGASQIATNNTNNIAGEGHAEENSAVNEGIVPNDVDFNVDKWLDITPEVVRGTTTGSEYLHLEWGIMNLERNVKSLGQDMLPSEEPLILFDGGHP